MSDERRIQGLDQEDRAIEQAMSQAMATGSEPRLVQGGDSTRAGLVREYTELFGLLPFELTPEAPSPQVKDRIMHRIRRGSDPAAEAADGRSAALEVVPQAASAVSAPAARRPWGSFAMAAMFAVCLIGLGFASGLVWQQRQQIDLLNEQLALVTSSPRSGEVLQTQRELDTLRDRFEMITVIARQAYPMRRVSHNRPSQTTADGIVYVCGQHQRWYLNLRGLEPPGADEEYRLWFMTDKGQVDGGVLEVGPGRSIEKDALTMPPGTKGFVVTRERIGPRDEPESLTILLGEQAINL